METKASYFSYQKIISHQYINFKSVLTLKVCNGSRVKFFRGVLGGRFHFLVGYPTLLNEWDYIFLEKHYNWMPVVGLLQNKFQVKFKYQHRESPDG